MGEFSTFETAPSPTGEEGVPPAIISISSIPFDTDDARYITNTDPIGIFTDYVIRNTYDNNLSRYMLGITSPGGFQGNHAAFVQLASPTLLWVCDWTACRYNSIPNIPNPDSKDANWVLLHVTPYTENIITGPDGRTALYRVSGTYVYGCHNPADNVFSQVQFGRPPWLEDSFPAGRTIPNDALSDGLINVTEFVGRR